MGGNFPNLELNCSPTVSLESSAESTNEGRVFREKIDGAKFLGAEINFQKNTHKNIIFRWTAKM